MKKILTLRVLAFLIDYQVAADLVDRAFSRTGPNQLWVTDITEHPREGKADCAVVLDAFSRRVVGWSIGASRPRRWSSTRWAWRSRPEPHRPGRSSTPIRVRFASWTFTQRAKDSGLVPSMGLVGDCFDNAMIEAFWSRMQVELLDRCRWKTRSSWPTQSLGYLESFHNRTRRHSALGMLTPIQFENTSTVA